MTLGSAVSLSTNLKTLTATRFFAALMIVIFHYYNIFGSDFSSGFYKKFYLGVDFFFILSGFILLHVYYEPLKNGSLNVRNFYIKRLAKIYPVHCILTCLFFLLLIIAGNLDKAAVYSFLSHMFLVHAWGVEAGLGFNSQSWSVSAEWFAYLLFPFMAPVFLKFSHRPVFLLSLAASSFLTIWFLSSGYAYKPMTEWTYHFSVFRIVPEFLLGMATYNFLKYYGACWKAEYVSIGSILLSVGLLVLSYPDWSIVLAFALMIYALASSEMTGKGVVHRVLSCKPLICLGEASYCLYMIHFLIIFFFVPFFFDGMNAKEFYGFLPVYVTLSIVASGLMYVFVETPLRHWITKKFIK